MKIFRQLVNVYKYYSPDEEVRRLREKTYRLQEAVRKMENRNRRLRQVLNKQNKQIGFLKLKLLTGSK